MSTRVTHTLNSEIANDRVAKKYPYLEILEPSDALAIVLPEMDNGELPVLCTIGGSTRRLASIRLSAIAIRDLSLITALSWHKDADTAIKLETIEDIMEVLS